MNTDNKNTNFLIFILGIPLTILIASTVPLIVWLKLSHIKTLEDLQSAVLYMGIIPMGVIITILLVTRILYILITTHDVEKVKNELPQLIGFTIFVPVSTTSIVIAKNMDKIAENTSVIQIKQFLLQHFGTIWVVGGLSILAIVIYVKEIKPKKKDK